MLKFNSKNYFFILACIFYSCQTSYISFVDKDTSVTTSLGSMQHTPIPSSRTVPKKYVVLLHGYCMNNENSPIQVAKEKLAKRLGDQFKFFMPTCREDGVSNQLSIKDQAALVIDELIKELKKDLQIEFPGWSEEKIEKAVKQIQLHIIGNSQGGCTAIALTKQLVESDDLKLNIRSVVSVTAPLFGLKMLENPIKSLWKSLGLTKVFPNSLKLKLSNKLKMIAMSIALKHLPSSLLCKFDIGPGLMDMHPSSNTGAEQAKFIDQPNLSIPILIIAAKVDKMSKYLDVSRDLHSSSDLDPTIISEKEKNLFDQGYSLAITGKKDGKHDGMISLDSQLCQRNTFNSPSENTPKHTKRIILEGNYFHCSNFILTPHLSFNDQQDTTAIESDEAVEHIEKFIYSNSR